MNISQESCKIEKEQHEELRDQILPATSLKALFFSPRQCLKQNNNNKKLEVFSIWPSNPTPRHISWEDQNWKRHMYPIVHCRSIYNIAWKQPRCPLTDEWIKKLWYIYTMQYYSAIKRNAFESVLMRWMNLEPIIQSEVSQKEKDKYHTLMHIYGI